VTRKKGLAFARRAGGKGQAPRSGFVLPQARRWLKEKKGNGEKRKRGTCSPKTDRGRKKDPLPSPGETVSLANRKRKIDRTPILGRRLHPGKKKGQPAVIRFQKKRGKTLEKGNGRTIPVWKRSVSKKRPLLLRRSSPARTKGGGKKKGRAMYHARAEPSGKRCGGGVYLQAWEKRRREVLFGGR